MDLLMFGSDCCLQTQLTIHELAGSPGGLLLVLKQMSHGASTEICDVANIPCPHWCLPQGPR